MISCNSTKDSKPQSAKGRTQQWECFTQDISTHNTQLNMILTPMEQSNAIPVLSQPWILYLQNRNQNLSNAPFTPLKIITLKKMIYFCLCVYVRKCVSACAPYVCRCPDKGVGSPGTGVIGGFESLIMDTGEQTQVLYKSSRCSQLQSRISRLITTS